MEAAQLSSAFTTMVTSAVGEARTGVISFNRTSAGIYFLRGEPRHAFVRDGGAVVEGYAALRRILLRVARGPGTAEWRDLEAIPRQTVLQTATELLDVIARLDGTTEVALPRPPAAPQPVAWTLLDVVVVMALGPILTIVYPALTAIASRAGLGGAGPAFVVDAVLYILIGAGILWFFLRRRGASAQALGLRLPAPDWWIWTPAIAVATLGVTNTMALLQARIFGSTGNECQFLSAGFGSSLGLLYIAACGLAPVVEELAYRGLMFGWLRARFGPPLAVAVSACVFGLLHAQDYGFGVVPALVVAGAVFATIYHRSGSLLPAILAHAIFNAYAVASLAQHAGCS